MAYGQQANSAASGALPRDPPHLGKVLDTLSRIQKTAGECHETLDKMVGPGAPYSGNVSSIHHAVGGSIGEIAERAGNVEALVEHLRIRLNDLQD